MRAAALRSSYREDSSPPGSSESSCGQFSCGPDRQLQHLAQSRQIHVARASPITLPKVYARRADADLLGDFCDGKAAPKACIAHVTGEDRLPSHDCFSFLYIGIASNRVVPSISQDVIAKFLMCKSQVDRKWN